MFPLKFCLSSWMVGSGCGLCCLDCWTCEVRTQSSRLLSAYPKTPQTQTYLQDSIRTLWLCVEECELGMYWSFPLSTLQFQNVLPLMLQHQGGFLGLHLVSWFDIWNWTWTWIISLCPIPCAFSYLFMSLEQIAINEIVSREQANFWIGFHLNLFVLLCKMVWMTLSFTPVHLFSLFLILLPCWVCKVIRILMTQVVLIHHTTIVSSKCLPTMSLSGEGGNYSPEQALESANADIERGCVNRATYCLVSLVSVILRSLLLHTW